MPPYRSLLFVLLTISAWGVFRSEARAGKDDKHLDFYFIDVEGGAALLMVSPTGESLLIDSGYPDHQGRDLNRILNVARDVAQLDHLDHAAVSHWHLDHYGNHAALAAVFPIRNFYDRGMPDQLQEDPDYPERVGKYRAATGNKSKTVKAGDEFTFDSPAPLKLKIVTASREVIPNVGPPNPYADEHKPQPDDPSDNSASVSCLVQFGKFKFLACGDLTWNIEAKLVLPNNPLGQVDLFMVTHHGLGVSNNPVLVHAIDPVAAVMCNGPSKGGELSTYRTLTTGKSLKALYQLHRNINLKDDEQTPLDETLAAYDKLIHEGKIRFIGASNYSAARLREAFGVPGATLARPRRRYR